MTTSEGGDGLSWRHLTETTEEETQDALVVRLKSLAQLPKDEQEIQFGTMILTAAKLPTEKAVLFTRFWLRAWLQMDPEMARMMVESYRAALAWMSADIAWQRLTTVQRAVKGLSPEEQGALHCLFPQEVPESPATGIGFCSA